MLWAKQAINNALYYCNRPNITSVYDFLLNFKVLMWRKSGNWTRPYYLLAIEDKIYYIQLFNRLISFRRIFIKPFFQFKNTYDIKLDKLEILAKLNKL